MYTCAKRSVAAIMIGAAVAPLAFSQQVTFAPYIQLGDNGPFGATDQIVIAWQTDETAPKAAAYGVELQLAKGAAHAVAVVPEARVIANYLAADSSLPTVAGAYGAHSNYTAVLRGLEYDTNYRYRVTGPGLPAPGFTATFHSRKRGPVFSFVVTGDGGFFPALPNSKPAVIVDYEARIAHLIHNVASLEVPSLPRRPSADFILNTGDNVYLMGSEDNYRDFFFPVYNSGQDSNESGAPLLRSQLYFIAPGNHDLGRTGAGTNLLADNAAPAFSGNLGGGDALAYFNDFYFPQNGPVGFDIQNAWNVDKSTPSGLTFGYQGKTYNSPAALAAFRQSTQVNTGKGASVQIDHQSNYSFDYGSAHFLFLDANPHLFNDNLPNGNAFNAPPPTFVPYPSALGQWVVNDLDSSRQLWKIVVYHQAAFTSGDATIANGQMRAIAQLLEDHGVNVVFAGHEHNYQRSLPVRATERTSGPVSTTAAAAAVNVDTQFDGLRHTVPDGVLYLVEGAGGNRDFDGAVAAPRGSGPGLDQDDSATGTFVAAPGLTVPQGPGSWLDTHLTNPEMSNFFANAGAGPKITARFKSKVFSFGDVVVDQKGLTLYQISEPLQSTSSATTANPAPYGTDVHGVPLHDPIPDTQVDPVSGRVVSVPATGASALLDAWTVTKPDVGRLLKAKLAVPREIKGGQTLTYEVFIRNDSEYALSGTQVRFHLPKGLELAAATRGDSTVQGDEVVFTLGHLAAGAGQTVEVSTLVPSDAHGRGSLRASADVYSSTAQPVESNSVVTHLR
jgi:hypothetical protein